MLARIILAGSALIVATPCALAQVATDWCTADARPADAMQFGPEKPVGNGSVYWKFPSSNLPQKVWCYAHDDHGRSSQCVGLSIHQDVGTECGSLSWIRREVRPSGVFNETEIQFENQHSSDWRYFSIWYK